MLGLCIGKKWRCRRGLQVLPSGPPNPPSARALAPPGSSAPPPTPTPTLPGEGLRSLWDPGARGQGFALALGLSPRPLPAPRPSPGPQGPPRCRLTCGGWGWGREASPQEAPRQAVLEVPVTQVEGAVGSCVAPHPGFPAAPRARRGSPRPRSAGPGFGGAANAGTETPGRRREGVGNCQQVSGREHGPVLRGPGVEGAGPARGLLDAARLLFAYS